MSLVTVTMRKYAINPIQHSGYESLVVHSLCFFFFFLLCLPFKTLSRVSPSLLFPLFPFRSPLRFPPLWLWKPAVANYGETKGRTWMGSPAARPGRQRGREAGSLSVPVQSSSSFLPLPYCSEHRTQGRNKTQEDNAANVHSDPGSPIFLPCFLLTFTLLLSSSSSLSSPLLGYSFQFVNRSLLMWFAVCISSAFTAPSFLLPPSPRACPPFTLRPSEFFFPHTTPSFLCSCKLLLK